MFPSNAGHEKSCVKLPRPRGKAKYSLMTDSVQVTRVKAEKNSYKESEIVPETISLQVVEAL